MGGKAFEGITRRVTKDEVASTVTWFMNAWPDWNLNPTLNLHQALLGSAGKNETSGDIDLNLEITSFDQTKVAQQIIELLGEDKVKPRPGHNQIFTAVPISGDPANGYVQVDLMFGDYVWQKFSYFSPEYTDTISWSGLNRCASGFKGLYRTEFIKALVAFNSDWVLEEGGKMIARVGPTFFHDKGLVWRYRHRPMRKDGKGRIQALVELNKDDFLAIYPTAMPAKANVINDPETVAKLLFDNKVASSDLNTLEYMARLLRRHYDRDQINKIIQIYHERLNSLKVEIPLSKFRQIWLR